MSELHQFERFCVGTFLSQARGICLVTIVGTRVSIGSAQVRDAEPEGE